jgi:adenine-specific DNA-methyltransferase
VAKRVKSPKLHKPPKPAKAPKSLKHVETLRHTDDKRRNIPTAEHQSVLEAEDVARKEVRYPRNTDLDPQLVWRGKDYQDWSDLVVQAPPLYIQEKVHPKVLIDDLLRESNNASEQASGSQIDLFADFNGVTEGADRTDFYQHDQNWTNRMILGDSLQVMASLAEREGIRGRVQCIYIDPPYGIKFNSNFQWSTTSRDVKDGNVGHITREPEQVKAFRDTWRDGIHSYLTYLRDRLTVARDLLAESGSVFVQIGDENVHRVRALMDEILGEDNFIAQISTKTSGGSTGVYLPGTLDYVLWFAKSKPETKFRQLFGAKALGEDGAEKYSRIRLSNLESRPITSAERERQVALPQAGRVYRQDNMTSQSVGRSKGEGAASWFPVSIEGLQIRPSLKVRWKTNELGMNRLLRSLRVETTGNSLAYVRYLDDFGASIVSNAWTDIGGIQSRSDPKVYVVQTPTTSIQRCILMATDPGDLVLDPTCGSGTTAYVAEQWGRRWITIDTSRVALALARARIMGARYLYYLLSDSPQGLRKEAEISGRAFADRPTHLNIRHGLVCERLPHITLKSITNNSEIDVIWDEHQPKVQAALGRLNAALRGHSTPFRLTTGGREGKDIRFDAPAESTLTLPSGDVVSASELLEWEVPHNAESPWPAEAQSSFYRLRQERARADGGNAKKLDEYLRAINHNLKNAYTLRDLPERPADPWPQPAQQCHLEFWEARIARQRAIDASIAAKVDSEFLYDRPYTDPKTVRVAGPFTVESLSPHRTLGVDENDELIDPLQVKEGGPPYGQTFEQMILENLRTAGVQQAHKEDRISFTSLTPWPGEMVCAEGRYREADIEKRAAIFIGPEFGTVSRPDLVAGAREAGDAGFDVLIACAFNYDAHASEFSKLGRIPVLKARMNADLHMGGELKATGKGNLFVIFGEPDIEVLHEADGRLMVHVKGVDVFDPTTGEVRSDGADGIACWFIDTDYNEESFFVRHAYFLGQNDPYGALKTTLKAEIDPDVWATLNSDISRPFPMPKGGRIAVKVINHLGDEVMKVFRIE